MQALSEKSQLEQVLHDINSPIEAMKGLINNLQQVEPKSRRLLNLGIERIQTLVQSLDTAQAQSPMKPTQTARLDSLLHELVEHKRWEYKLMEGIYFNLKTTGPCHSMIDQQSFTRALSNLINNAVEAVGENGVIDITLRRGISKNIITISDNGVGIPSPILSKLFKRGVSYAKPQGKGLGLSYAKDIIESLGGCLIVHSQINLGCEVTVMLPTAPAPNHMI